MPTIGLDTETFLIQPGLQIPKLVCMSWYDGRKAYLLERERAVPKFRELLEDPTITFAMYNAAFDLAVLARQDISLLPLIRDAILAGRIRCGMIRAMLFDIASGDFAWQRKKTYSLARMIERKFERTLAKEDTYRLRYAELDGFKAEDYPSEARTYAMEDARWHYLLWAKQEMDLQEDELDEVPNERPQTRAALWLYMMGAWGLRSDAATVNKLDREMTTEMDVLRVELVKSGIVRSKTKRDTKLVNEAGDNLATVCSLLAKSKKLSVNQKLVQQLILEDCQTRGVVAVRTPSGQICMDDEELEKTKDERLRPLRRYSELGHNYGLYMPFLKEATRRPINPRWNVLVETGRTSCVAKGTLIEVVRDVSKFPKGVPIEDVQVGDLAYAYTKAGDLVLRPVTWVGKTGHKRVVRVHWRGSGHHTTGFVDLTPEHRVKLTSGRWIAAGNLRPNMRVMALSRGLSNGYARLWPTGVDEITREHRFIYEQVYGVSAEHVHHANGNKLDNRVLNLEGMTASDHTSEHSKDPSLELRQKRSELMKKRWKEGQLKVRRGSEAPNWLGLTSEWLVDELKKYDGHPTKLARAHKIDYTTLKKYLFMFDVPHKTRNTRPLKNNHEILSVEILHDAVDVYDLSIKGVHNFIANEICVHNCAKPNLQNPPRKGGFRECFVPRPGYLYAFADYDTLELRTHAQNCLELFGYSKLADDLIAGKDPHTAFGADLLGISYEEMAQRLKDGDPIAEEARQDAKPGNFGLPGGMGIDAMIAYYAGYGRTLTRDRAMMLKQKWLGKYSENVDYFSRTSDIVGDGTATQVQLKSGRVRGKCRYTDFNNGYFQARAADGAKDALCHVSEECYLDPTSPLYGSRPIIFLHDEIGTEVRASTLKQASDAALRMQAVMEARMQTWIPNIPAKATVVLMRRWYKGAKPVYRDGMLVPSKPVKTPDGKTKWVEDVIEERVAA